MSMQSLGKVTVATSGTLVRLSATTLNVNAVFFQALGTNTAYVYVGLSTLVRATYVGVLLVVPAPTAATGATVALPSASLQSGVSVAPIDLSTIYLDADSAPQSLLISYLLT
jgi:hypothetical protein